MTVERKSDENYRAFPQIEVTLRPSGVCRRSQVLGIQEEHEIPGQLRQVKVRAIL